MRLGGVARRDCGAASDAARGACAQEFLAGTLNLSALNKVEHLKTAFASFDTDGDGKITREELEAGLQVRQGLGFKGQRARSRARSWRPASRCGVRAQGFKGRRLHGRARRAGDRIVGVTSRLKVELQGLRTSGSRRLQAHERRACGRPRGATPGLQGHK